MRHEHFKKMNAKEEEILEEVGDILRDIGHQRSEEEPTKEKGEVCW